MAKKNNLFEEDVYSKDFRAKQFLPFNSLRGYYTLLKEKDIVRVDKKKLSEDELELLQEKYSNVKKGKMVRIRYYKDYGYVDLNGMVANIDEIYRTITIVKTKINLDDVIDIEVLG